MLTHIHKPTERVTRETTFVWRRALDEVLNDHWSRVRHGRDFYAHLARSTAVRAAPRRRILHIHVHRRKQGADRRALHVGEKKTSTYESFLWLLVQSTKRVAHDRHQVRVRVDRGW